MPVFGIEQARFLDNRAAILDQFDLALDLVLDGLLDELERVDVLDLGPGAEGLGSDRHDRDVGVAAETALLHVAVADAELGHDLVELFQIGDRLVGGAQVRLGNDLQQRGAGPVQVDARAVLKPGDIAMHQLAGVLLHMDAGDADPLVSARPPGYPAGRAGRSGSSNWLIW